jgi:hypothetical protein
MPADSTIASPIKFLGCTVVSFSCTLGFNGSSSTLDVQLVEDTDENFTGHGTLDYATTESALIASIKGGSEFLSGNPGSYHLFQNGNFKFGGIVTSWRRTHSTSGRLINVQLSDPRSILKDIPVITDHCPSFGGGITQWDGYNVVTPLNTFANAVAANWTTDGMIWRNILDTRLQQPTYNFYGKTYKIVFDGTFTLRVPVNYRVQIQNASVEDFINRVAKDNNIDWYAVCESLETDSNKIISVRGISRVNQYALTNDSINTFISSLSDKLSSYEIGRELRTDPTKAIFIGDNKRTLHINTNLSQVYHIGGDGYICDQPFIDLSSIHSENSDLISGLPTVTLGAIRSTKTNGSVVGSTVGSPTTSKTKLTLSKQGYIATERILRAALHSKEAWATAVWYAFRYLYTSGLTYTSYSAFHQSKFIAGTHAGTTQTISFGTLNSIPLQMGIYAPPFNREAPSFSDVPTTFLTGYVPSPQTEALKEACYQATLRVAQEYYGKVFVGFIGDDPAFSSISGADLGSNTGSYIYSGKKIPLTYEVCDAATDLSDPQNDNLVHNLYGLHLNTDSGAFKNDQGLFRPYCEIDFGTLSSNRPTAKLENLEPASYLKISKANTSVPASTSDCYLLRSDVSIEQYKFDPRYFIATINEPFNVGFDAFIVVSFTVYSTSTDAAAIDANPRLLGTTKTVDTVFNTTPSLTTKKDKSIGTQEFLAWLYSDYTISATLEDITPASKTISAKKYMEMINSSSKIWQEKIGLAERRYTPGMGAGFKVAVPLKWRFLKYGPFVGTGTNVNFNLRPTQVIEDTSLSPWTYGNIGNMNIAGNILADNSSGQVSTVGYASITVAGLPEYSIGYEISSGDAVVSNLADISLSYGSSGFTTTYRFKTFFGPTGFRRKQEIDAEKSNTFRLADAKKEFIKLDSIVRDYQPESGKKFIYIDRSKSTPATVITTGQDKNTAVDTSYLMCSTSPGMEKPNVSLISGGAIKEMVNADVDGTYIASAYAGLSEIFTPVGGAYPETLRASETIIPSIHGMPIGGTVAFTATAAPTEVDPKYIPVFEIKEFDQKVALPGT